jgi:hypothetical protein
MVAITLIITDHFFTYQELYDSQGDLIQWMEGETLYALLSMGKKYEKACVIS